MPHFDRLTTTRLQVQLRDLPIIEAIRLARMPDLAVEAENTMFLRAAIQDGGAFNDPALWTVQERNLAVCHYLMCLQPDDMPRDFQVGTAGSFSDYFDGSADIPAHTISAPVELGEVDGTVYGLRHLCGYMVESIERIAASMLPEDATDNDRYLHWLFGAMAAQLVVLNAAPDSPVEPEPDQISAYDDWLTLSIQGLQQMSQDEFTRVLVLYTEGKPTLYHLFDWEISPNGGIQFLPIDGKGKEAAADLPPATFPVRTCITPAAARLGRNTR